MVFNTIGIIIFSLAINLFIEPSHLYSGGVLGLSQLLNNFLGNIFGLNRSITSIIYFILNIPLFILAYYKINKQFCYKTIYSIVIQTLALAIIPIPEKMLVNELITNVLIGGALSGIGCALILSSTGSTGGSDIIGIVLTNHNHHFSVGKFALLFNTLIYVISGFLYGLPTMIYSFMNMIVENLTIDKFHEQNICSDVMIFSKNKPTEILNFIKNDLDRGATWWKGTGIYNNTDTYITYVALSRYEFYKMENYIKKSNQDVFITKNDFVKVYGEFDKRLSK